MGAQSTPQMFIPASPQYAYSHFAPNGAVIYNQAPLQYPSMPGYRPFHTNQAVYFPTNISYNPNPPRVSGPQIASVPVQQSMSSSTLSQQSVMANQVGGTPPVQAAPVQKRPSRALAIIDPVTKQQVHLNNSSVDASETVSLFFCIFLTILQYFA